jgi:hypothetical protein
MVPALFQNSSKKGALALGTVSDQSFFAVRQMIKRTLVSLSRWEVRHAQHFKKRAA